MNLRPRVVGTEYSVTGYLFVPYRFSELASMSRAYSLCHLDLAPSAVFRNRDIADGDLCITPPNLLSAPSSYPRRRHIRRFAAFLHFPEPTCEPRIRPSPRLQV